MRIGLHRSGDRGGILIPTLLMVLLLGGLSASLLTVQFHRDRLKAELANKINALYNAEGGVNYAVELYSHGFVQAGGGKRGNLTEFRYFLTDNNIADLPPQTWVTVPLAGFKPSSGAKSTIQAYRTDTADYTDLRFKSTVEIAGHSETVESTFRGEGKTFNGFKFALFTNNISCSFCHTEIDNIKKFDGLPYERVRVATLESLMLRGGADATIAGTLYTQGKLMDSRGGTITSLANTNVDGWSFKDGLVDPKTTRLVDMIAAPVGIDGKPVPGYNLYRNYPTDPTLQSDGRMPTDFPSIFPDNNQNRIIDEDEYQLSASNAFGKLSGYGFVVPKGSTYGGTSLPTTEQVSISNQAEGNLILNGTAANPIRIDGKVEVNGDVVIQGVVQGTGSIVARGNIYVTGDLTYNDKVVNGKRVFGVAADGTANGLGLAAGGNVLVGDYLTPKGGSLTTPTSLMNGTASGGFGFLYSEMSIFNRREWQKTQPLLPGLVKKSMVKNSTYIPGYKPKYYVVQKGTPVYAFIKGSYWNDANKTWMGPEHAGSIRDLTQVKLLPGAVTLPLNPTSNWISPTQLKQLWIADEAKRISGTALKFDGLVYTDNTAFALARGSSKSKGDLTINGALVARDTGILAGGTFRIFYDERVTGFLDIKEQSSVEFHRVVRARRSDLVKK